MEITEITKKQQRAHDRQKAREQFKRTITLLKAKILNKGIDPNDKRTLQVHADGQGNKRDYYISNPYLQTEAKYIAVSTILEDEENSRYVYRGLVGGADNATGVIESNVSLAEIVASPNGNISLQQMLSPENAKPVYEQYCKYIGVSTERLKGHASNFGKPDFVLGTILRGEKGEFTFSSEIQSDIEQMLEEERKERKKEDSMRIKDAVEIDLGGGMVISQQDCWMEQGKKLRFAGINSDALYYAYEPDKPVKTFDGKYVYVGTTQIGKSAMGRQSSNMPIQFANPFVYQDVVLWTDNKTLIQYFMDNKLDGLNFELGNTFTNGRIKCLQKNGSPIILGGISLDEQGKCVRVEETPGSVKTTVEQYICERKEQGPQIIKFNGDYQEEK